MRIHYVFLLAIGSFFVSCYTSNSLNFQNNPIDNEDNFTSDIVGNGLNVHIHVRFPVDNIPPNHNHPPLANISTYAFIKYGTSKDSQPEEPPTVRPDVFAGGVFDPSRITGHNSEIIFPQAIAATEWSYAEDDKGMTAGYWITTHTINFNGGASFSAVVIAGIRVQMWVGDDHFGAYALMEGTQYQVLTVSYDAARGALDCANSGATFGGNGDVASGGGASGMTMTSGGGGGAAGISGASRAENNTLGSETQVLHTHREYELSQVDEDMMSSCSFSMDGLFFQQVNNSRGTQTLW